MRELIFYLFTAFTCTASVAQTTFQKIFTGDSDVQCFGAYQTSDDGYIFTGIANVNGTNKIFLTRTDCHGEILWSKTYSNTSSWNNISQRVIETFDHGFLLAASIGSFGAYNILLVRVNASGHTQWMKIMQGSGDDGVNSVIQTSTQEFVIAGSTSSYGQDAGSFYKDVYLMKVDDEGNLLWGKTFGTENTYDEAFDVIETFDGHYAVTGRYIVQETFQCFLLKTDPEGEVVFMKAFGDTLQHTVGFALANTLDGGYVITGSSTLNKESFLDYPDEFLIKTNSAGDTLWCRSYRGSSIDGSENGSSVVVVPDGSYAIGVATFSYPTVGFVPNKHCVLKTDAEGHLEFCRAYNSGGSHYPYLTASKGGDGYVLSGFSNYYTPAFSATLTKLDSDFESGCYQTDVTDLTFQQSLPAKISTPAYETSSGGSLVNATAEADFVLSDTTLCFSSADTCTVFTTTGEWKANSVSLQVYPNPAADRIMIAGWAVGKEEISWRIQDAMGNRVLQGNVPGAEPGHIIISVAALAPGLYLFFAEDGTLGLPAVFLVNR
jgi:hypothetical protein